jgi:hypothetical protein
LSTRDCRPDWPRRPLPRPRCSMPSCAMDAYGTRYARGDTSSGADDQRPGRPRLPQPFSPSLRLGAAWACGLLRCAAGRLCGLESGDDARCEGPAPATSAGGGAVGERDRRAPSRCQTGGSLVVTRAPRPWPGRAPADQVRFLHLCVPAAELDLEADRLRGLPGARARLPCRRLRGAEEHDAGARFATIPPLLVELDPVPPARSSLFLAWLARHN